MSTAQIPVARGPLVNIHRDAGATIDIVDGWELAIRYPKEQSLYAAANVIVDLSHRSVHEFSGRTTGKSLRALCGAEPPVRSIQVVGKRTVFRLTESRAVVFGSESLERAIDVTGGWATVALIGLDATRILNKLTAVDLRETTLPVGHCCQGPLFGVNVLFGRLADGFELHACPDSLQFLWELLLDAGEEFQLQPAGTEWFASRKTTSAI